MCQNVKALSRIRSMDLALARSLFRTTRLYLSFTALHVWYVIYNSLICRSVQQAITSRIRRGWLDCKQPLQRCAGFPPCCESHVCYFAQGYPSTVSVDYYACCIYAARNLGVILDSSLTFSEHISSVSKSCFLHS